MLQEVVDWILFSLIGFDKSLSWVSALNFFIYDSVKILILFFIMITAAGFLRTYISQKKVKEIVGNGGITGNIIAALFGAATPFCSCSSIPIFISFINAGVPLGVSFSFLVTSPIVNEYLLILMISTFGWKIGVSYVLSGIILGVMVGKILGNMKLEKYLLKDIKSSVNEEKKYTNVKQRILFGFNESMSIIKGIWIWVLVGVGIGAIIHGYVPDSVVHSLVSAGGIFAVPMAVLLGVPIYASCAAIVPIAVALFSKGVPLGTALAFMMSTAALSFPEAVILRRVMKLKLIIIFFAVVAFCIVLTGYLYNILQNFLV